MTLSKARQGIQLLNTLGPQWVASRLVYALRMRTGRLEKAMPAYEWSERSLASWLKPNIPSTPEAYVEWRRQNQPRFLFSSLPAAVSLPDLPVEQADALLQGNWRYFEHEIRQAAFPPDWHLNPLDHERWPDRKHWSRISDFGGSDIKYVWELNRFSFAFTLARAYAKTGDETYAEAFWQLVLDWRKHNYPQRGANWKCGQETSIRLMAWCFGLYAFQASPASTPERISQFVPMIAAEAERVEKNIGYARSTRSNHGISEGMGLWTVGLLFPELAQAARWKTLGKTTLIHEIGYQFEPDGTYTMHSLNYLRSVQQTCLWCVRLGEVNDDPLPPPVYDAISRSLDFVYQLVDLETGQVPQHGSNDGAFLLPLDSCDFTDYRPLLQLGYRLFHHQRLLPEGAWDEPLLWFWGDTQAEMVPPVLQKSARFPDGGYYTLRSPESWVLIHAPVFHERPNQADLLHVDITWKHLNIACDAGTFMYNAPDPWNNALSKTQVHNTVSVDSLDQMTRVTRFTWLDWARSSNIRTGQMSDGWLEFWQGEQDGYQRLPDPVRHRRAVVRLGTQDWLVVDHLEGKAVHDYRLQWLLSDFPHHVEADIVSLETPQGIYHVTLGSSASENSDFSVVRADPESTRGWRSRYYGAKEPALSCVLSARSAQAWFWSLFGTSESTITVTDHALRVQNIPEKWQVALPLDQIFSAHPVFETTLSAP